MEIPLLIIVLVGSFTICAGAISQARNQLKAVQAYVKERYGEDLDMDTVEAHNPLPAWMNAIDGWYYPDRLGQKLLRAGRALGIVAPQPVAVDEIEAIAPVVPLAGHSLAPMRGLNEVEVNPPSGVGSNRGQLSKTG